jgi:hypothetical protein
LANVGLGPELIKKKRKKRSLIYTRMESDKWSFMLGLREKNRLNKEKK